MPGLESLNFIQLGKCVRDDIEISEEENEIIGFWEWLNK